MMKGEKVETEILNSSSLMREEKVHSFNYPFNDSEAQRGSSIVCLSNETVHYDNTITESGSFASFGNMVNITYN